MILELLQKTSRSALAVIINLNVRLTKMTNKNRKEIHKNIQLRFIDSCRFMGLSIDKPAFKLDDINVRTLESLKRCMYIHIRIWIARRKLKKQSYHQKNAFYSKLYVRFMEIYLLCRFMASSLN